MNGIPPLNGATVGISPLAGGADSNVTNSTNSKNLFAHLIDQANNDQLVSDDAIRDFVEQKPGVNVQQVVMAVAKAEMSFQFFMEIRNQMIDSYTELMRMQF